MMVEVTFAMVVTAGVGLVKVCEKLWDKFVETKREDEVLKRLSDVDTKLDAFGESMARVASSLDHVTDVLERIEQRQANDDMVDAVVEKFNAVSLKSRS